MAAVPFCARGPLEKLRELSLRLLRSESAELKDLGELLDDIKESVEMAFEDIPGPADTTEELRAAVKAVKTM